MTQIEFANYLEVSFQSVNRWETGKFDPTMKIKRKLAPLFEKYEIEVDLSPEGIEPSRRRQPLEEALVALEESTDIMRKPGFNSDDMVTLRRLPLWDNFQRWQNLLLVGLILASQESTADPRKNKAVEELMNETKKLYE